MNEAAEPEPGHPIHIPVQSSDRPLMLILPANIPPESCIGRDVRLEREVWPEFNGRDHEPVLKGTDVILFLVFLVLSAVVVASVLFSLRSLIANWISAIAAVPVSARPRSVSSPAITSLPLVFVLFALTALAAIGGFAVYAAVHRK